MTSIPSQPSTASSTNTNGNGHLSTDALVGIIAQLPPARQERIKNHVESEVKAEFEQDLDSTSSEPALPEDGGEHCTDMGNSERLIRRYGKEIRHSEGLGFLVFDGKRWIPDEAGVMERAKKTVTKIYAEAAEAAERGDRERTEELSRHAIRSENGMRLREMVRLSKTVQEIQVTADNLDKHPWAFNVSNGTLDLRTGKRQPHNPADLITKLSPIEYDEGAECPTWERFLQEVFGGKQALIDFVRRAIAYSLTGETREQVLLFCSGEGSNGKSTLLDVIGEMMGDYSMETPAQTFLVSRSEGIRNDLAMLRGARLVFASETGEGRKLDEALLKNMTGGEKIVSRFLNHEYFSYEPGFTPWLASNHRPRITGTDHAIWRRLLVIPFDKKRYRIDEEGEPKRDMGLKEKLKAELPGILAWVVKECPNWYDQELQAPDEVKLATDAYKSEMDMLARFLEEQCECDPQIRNNTDVLALDTSIFVPAADLYDSYKTWSEAEGEKYLTKTMFGKRLGEKGFVSGKVGNNQSIWRGLKLK